MRRDRISNEKVIDFFAPAAQGSGIAYFSTIFDTQRLCTGQNNREACTNIMIIISIASGWSAGGLLDCRLQCSASSLASSMFDYAIISQMGGAESEDLYLAEVKDFNRYIRLVTTPLVANVTLCAIGTANRSRREPVCQEGREKAVRYAANPTTA
jgi:hypothetical protein